MLDWQSLAGQVTQTLKDAAQKVDESLEQAFKEQEGHDGPGPIGLWAAAWALVSSMLKHV